MTNAQTGPRVGVVFPQTELSRDTGALRTWVQEVERLGYRHVLAYDHVVGADPEAHAPWTGPYDIDTTFREPFVFFGYLAALSQLELVTGIIILPQRQTALVAKQAAEVDLLTDGRFRLGVGIGWNRVEYDSLGKDFTNRGRRSEEQIALLRELWTKRRVDFDGEYERVEAAGLSPLPRQQPIPLWFGGQSPKAYERIGRLADGWFPQVPIGPELSDALRIIETAARKAGRTTPLPMESRVSFKGDPDAVAKSVADWADAGATHVSINTMGAGLATVDDHLAALGRVAESLGR